MIRYTNHRDYYTGELEYVAVKIAGRKVGEIRRVDGGWRYFPSKSVIGGEVFSTLTQCMDSLEAR